MARTRSTPTDPGDEPAAAPSLREARSAVGRARLLDAAGELFRANGYRQTTIAEISRRSGVSVQTVYNLAGSKPQLLKLVYDRAVAGDDDPVAMVDRDVTRELMEATDPQRWFALYAEHSVQLFQRVGPYAQIISAGAAAGDEDLRDLNEVIEVERATGTRLAASWVVGVFGGREGLTEDEAADIVWAYTAPEMVHRLVTVRGWTWARFEDWFATTLAEALLGPSGPAEPGR